MATQPVALTAMCRLTGIAPSRAGRSDEQVAAELAAALAGPAGPGGHGLAGARLRGDAIDGARLLRHLRDVVVLAARTQQLAQRRDPPGMERLVEAARGRVEREVAWFGSRHAPDEALREIRARMVGLAVELSERRKAHGDAREERRRAAARGEAPSEAPEEEAAGEAEHDALVAEHRAIVFAAIVAGATNDALQAMAVDRGASTLKAIRVSGAARFAGAADRLEELFAQAAGPAEPAGAPRARPHTRGSEPPEPPAPPPDPRRGIRLPHAVAVVALVVAGLALLLVTGVIESPTGSPGDDQPGSRACAPELTEPDPADARARAVRRTGRPERLDPVVVGTGPAALTVGHEGIFVASTDGISLIDPETGQRSGAAVPVTRRPASLADAPFSIALSRERLWIARRDGRLVSLDRESLRRVGRPVRYGGGPATVALAGGYVWVNNYKDRHAAKLTRIHPCTGQVRRFGPFGRGANTVYAAFGSLWVTDSVDAALHRIDPRTGRRVATVKKLADPQDVVAAFGRLWVNEWGGRLQAIDPATNEKDGPRLRTGPGPGGIAAGADALWIPLSEDGRLLAVHPRRGTGARVPLGGRLTDVEVAFGRAWVPDNDGDSVFVVGL